MPGNILLKGYTAAISSRLTTELNSLADGSVCALSGGIDNTSNLDAFADFQLDLASLTITSTTAFVTLYLVPTVDGTNYPDFATGAVGNYHGQYAVGSFLVRNVSATTARAMLTGVPIPPGNFKVGVRNGVGAAFAASGSTLGSRTYANSYT